MGMREVKDEFVYYSTFLGRHDKRAWKYVIDVIAMP